MLVSGWRSWLKRLSSSAKASRRSAGRIRRPFQPHPEALEDRLAPATFVWDGGGTDNRWSTKENWVGDVAPSPTGRLEGGLLVFDDLVFPPATAQFDTSNDFVNATFSALTFSGSGYRLNAQTGPEANRITLSTPVPNTGAIIANLGATDDVINFNITLGAVPGNRQFFTVGTIGAQLTINGEIDGTGVELSKNGPGTLVLAGDNTGFTGDISVTEGPLRVRHQNALGVGGASDGKTVVLQNVGGLGGVLQVETPSGVPGITIPEHIILNDGGPDGRGALVNIAGNNTWTGTVTMDSNVTLGSEAGTLIIAAEVQDLGIGYSLTKEGPSEVALAHANTYRGLTTVNAGILTVQHPLALGEAGLAGNGTVVHARPDRTGTLRIDDPTGVGFTVDNEVLTLDGAGYNSLPLPGVPDPAGALNNFRGKNVWTGDIALGSAPPLGSNVSIGVEANSELSLTGTLTDGDHALTAQFNLTKTRPGRLILTNTNTYGGNTIVANGQLNIRDSRALGATTRGTTVNPGAALELEVDDRTDSVTGTLDTLRIVDEQLLLNGTGAPAGSPSTGALRNISGTNEWTGPASPATPVIILQTSSAIGVDPDNFSNPAQPIFSQLTISTPIAGNTQAALSKVLGGELVLTASNTYQGVTNIVGGWITARNDRALGADVPGRTRTLQPRTNVSNGAALVLKQTTAGANLTIFENITLAGNGINHRFSWLNQKGALLNLGGNNVMLGDVLLDSNVGGAGIGAEVEPGGPASELTLRGSIQETTVNGAGGIRKLGSKRLILQGDGTYSGVTDIVEGVLRIQNDTALGSTAGGTVVQNGTALELMGALPIYQGGLPQAGIQVGREALLLNGPGNTSVTGTLINTLTNLTDDTIWRGPITFQSNVTIDTIRDTRLTIAGVIDDGQTGQGFGFTKTGEGKLALAGTNVFRGNTLVNQGIINLQNGQALGLPIGGTTVAANASVEIQGDITVAGEPLALQGDGVDYVNASPTRWFQRGPAPIANSGGPPTNLAIPSPGSPQPSLGLPGSGRVTGVAGDPQDPNVIYISTSGGGAWRTKDGGRSWQPITDSALSLTDVRNTLFTGAIAVAPTNPNIIYVGTGEANNGPTDLQTGALTVFYGRGVLKSTDYGQTWTLIQPPGSAFNRQTISKIVVDPVDPNVIYVATADGDPFTGLGNAFGTSQGSTGIWRYDPQSIQPWLNLTQDICTWTTPRITAAGPGPDDATGTYFQPNDDWSDLQVVATGPQTRVILAALGNNSGLNATGAATNAVYTGTYNRAIEAIELPICPPLFGIGATFMIWRVNAFPTGLDGGFPRNGVIKIGTNGATSYAAITYAMFHPLAGFRREIQRTINLGGTWAATTTNPPEYMGGQGFFNTAVAVDPSNPNIVYVGGTEYPQIGNAIFGTGGLYRSGDGGATWARISIGTDNFGPHPDTHALAFDASGRLLSGDDGGIWRLENPIPGQNRWSSLNGTNLATTTAIGLAIHPTDPNFMLIGTQDNGTIRNTGDPAWRTIAIGDGGYARIDPKNPRTAYHTRNGLSLERTDDVTALNPGWTAKVQGINAADPANFYIPFIIDRVNTSRLLLGTNKLYETTNRADLWQPIGGQGVLGTSGWTSTAVINAIAMATLQGRFATDPGFPTTTNIGADTYDPDTIYVATSATGNGTNAGRIYVTKNHGRSWVDRSGGGLPAGEIFDIQVDPRNRDYAYVVFGGFNSSGLPGVPVANKVFMTRNAGRNWVDISAGLPDLPTYRLVIDPRYGNPDNPTLYVGNDDGVWVRPAGATAFSRFGAGLARGQVRDMELNTTLNTLVVATHGRGVYDIQLDPQAANAGGLRAISGSGVWTGPITMTGDLVLGGESGSTLTILGPIGDNGANYRIIKIGADSKVVLGGTNTYGGVTEVREGVLGVRNPFALGKSTAETIVSNGAALELQSDVIGEPLVLEGNGISQFDRDTGALRNVSNNNRYTGPITFRSDVAIGVESGSRLTIEGVITDGTSTYSLIKEGTGTLALKAANTYDGQTIVQRGALDVQNALGLGSGGTQASGTTVEIGAQLQIEPPDLATPGITVANEYLTLKGTGIANSGALLNIRGDNTWQGQITIATTPTLADPLSPPVSVGSLAGSLDLAGLVTESVPDAQLIKVGPAKVILSGANNYAGQTTVVAGTLTVRNPQGLGSTKFGTVVNNGATLQLEALAPATSLMVTGESLDLNGNGVNNSGALNNLAGNNIWNGSITLRSTSIIGVEPNTTLTTQVAIAGASSADLIKSGAGTLIFPVANTYLGKTIVNQGVLNVRHAGALGGTTNGTIVNFNGTLQLQNSITVVNETLQLAGTGFNNAGALENVSGNNTWQGDIILTANATIAVDGAADRLIHNRRISEVGSGRAITKTGPGTLDYVGGSGFSNTYTGLTTVNEGTLLLEKTGGSTPFLGDLVIGDATGAASSAIARWLFVDEVPDTSKVTVKSDGLLDLNDRTDIIGGLIIEDGTARTGTGSTGILTTFSLDMTGGLLTTGALGSRIVLAGDVVATSSSVGPATIGSLGGVLDLGTAVSRAFTVNDGPNTTDLVISSPIIGTPRLVKSGTGTMQITSTTNTFSGGTNVAQGLLLVDGQIGNVDLSGGTLGGIGTVGTIISTSGTVAPGGAAGTLRALATVLSTNTTFDVDINGTQPGNGSSRHDQLIVDGDIDLAGAKLQGRLGNGFLSDIGDRFTIITTTNNGVVRGQFAQGSTVFFGGKKFTIAYNTRDVTLTRVKADTTTSLTTSVNPSVYGQPVTYTATVVAEPGAGIAPGGTVTFFLNGAPNTVVLDANGTATYTPNTLPVTNGVPHVVTVIYNESSDFNGSSGNTIFQTVNKADTDRVITASATPSVFGQPITFTVTVNAVAPGAGTPSGVVLFRVDGVDIGSPQTLNGAGQASVQVTGLSVGAHLINVSYTGDGNFNGFTSTRYANYQHTVIKSDSVVARVVASSNPITFGELVSFTTSVTAKAPGAGIPQGRLTFLDGVTPLGTVNLDPTGNGTINLTTALSGGTHSITAIYEGDGNFVGSDSSSLPLNFVVNPSGTTTSVTSSLPQSTFGQPVTFTAQVNALPPGQGVAPPTGTVTFTIDGIPADTVPLTGAGQAVFTTTSLIAGVHNVVATYNGDANFASSLGSTAQVVNKAGTTLGLTTSVNPAVPNQPVTFTAKVNVVAPGAGQPGGTVSFAVDGVDQGPKPLNAQGEATITLTFTTGGTRVITATYSGDQNFSGSSATLNQGVLRAATSTSVVSTTLNPSVYGQEIILSATVSPIGNATSTPSGTIAFKEGNTILGRATLDPAGRGRLPISTLTAGSHAIVATYEGDSFFDVSTSTSTLTQIVAKADTTITPISATPNPARFSEEVTFTVDVGVVAPGAGTVTGNVVFKEGATTLGTAPVDASGHVVFKTTTLSVGTHLITAQYQGDANFNFSAVTDPVTVTIDRSLSQVTVSSTANPSVFGQQAVVATVVPVAPATGTPTGTVTFTIDGSTTFGPVNLDAAGKALLPGNLLAVGTHTIVATYSGDASFDPSQSSSFSQTVNKASTTTSMTATPATVVFGQGVTLTATVAVVAPGAGQPGGTITFIVDDVSQAPVVLTNGSATLTLSSLAVGSHAITAQYNGDTSFNGSSSSPATNVTVNKANASVALRSSANPSNAGQPITLTATVTAVAPGGGLATGEVVFNEGNIVLGRANLNAGGSASVTVTLTGGTHLITATYSGDSNFNGATSSQLSQVVNKANTTTTASSSRTLAVVGRPVTITATVTAPVGLGTPTGTVSVQDGNTTIGSGSLVNGVATINVTFATAGTRTLRVVYSGDANFNGSTVNLSQQVGTVTNAYVAQVYLDLLGRQVDPNGLAYWSGLIDSGALNNYSFVLLIQNSTEYRAIQVDQAYRTYLRRPADPGALSGWVAFLQQGNNIMQLRAILIGSQEYFDGRGGGTNVGFLNALSQDVLGRTLDPNSPEFGYLLFLLQQFTPRSAIATNLMLQTEAVNRQVNGLFQTYLRRPADPNGLNWFTSYIQGGGTEEQVIAQLIASPEYLARL